jgi:hypothetical protein
MGWDGIRATDGWEKLPLLQELNTALIIQLWAAGYLKRHSLPWEFPVFIVPAFSYSGFFGLT